MNALSIMSLTSVLWSWLFYSAIWNTGLFDKAPKVISSFSWLVMAMIVFLADLLIVYLCKKNNVHQVFLILSIIGTGLFAVVQGIMMFLSIYGKGV